jgi:hypothetical protein
MSNEDAVAFAARHGLEAFRQLDPMRFAALLAQTAATGASLPRLDDKESGPAGIFRPNPRGTAA